MLSPIATPIDRPAPFFYFITLPSSTFRLCQHIPSEANSDRDLQSPELCNDWFFDGLMPSLATIWKQFS